MTDEFADEIWLPVPSKPGLMASSHGRVLFPVRDVQMPHGGWKKTSPKPSFGFKRKANKNARHVYMGTVNRSYGNIKIHRMVCEAFHGAAPSNKHVVIHLDEDATNNRASNLKWGTQKENLNMPNFIEYCKSRVGEKSPIAKHLAKKNAIQAV